MSPKRSNGRPFLIFALCLFGILLALFAQCLKPGVVFFSNDGPLGTMNQKAIELPAGYTGEWYDLNSIGNSGGTAMPNLSQAVFWFLGPVYWAKFFAPLVILFLGCSAWFFFRQLKLSLTACFIGGLAASLNSGFFSTACWGVGQQILAAGWSFLAMGAIVSTPRRWPWVRFPLAGLATGMVVMEGADVGALISFFIAAFGVWWGLISEGSTAKRFARGFGGVAIVTVFAFFMAAQVVSVQFKTAIQGVSDTQHDTMSKEQRWDWATQWSSPKGEFLSLVIPGIFGFRLDTPEGGNYWGRNGRDSAWDHYFASGNQGPPPDSRSHFIRHTGGGGYAGVLTVLIVIWAALQALRKKDSVFTLAERKVLWFCLAIGMVSLLLAFGRYAPFYHLVYRLPYFSSIRNPAKFGYLFGLALQLMFAFGIHALARKYIEVAGLNAADLQTRLKNWWAKVTGFDRRWVIGCWVALAASLLGWLLYASSRQSLEQYLQTVQFDGDTAKAIAGFSIKQVGWFILFYVLSAGALVLVLSGVFAGRRAKWGGIFLGALLVLDLGIANLPWLHPGRFWDVKEKYASNPVLEMLREKPYEHRVAIVPNWLLSAFQVPEQIKQAEDRLDGLYGLEWSQHLFLYNNIQSLDIVQMPRMPDDLKAYESALTPRSSETIRNIARRWELTNTRYVLGFAGFLDVLNHQFDPGRERFRIAGRFDIVPKSGIREVTKYEHMTAEPSTNGVYAVFEFTGALPRAKLYPAWEVNTNDQATLERLASPGFDPEKSVLVANPLPSPSPAVATNQTQGTVNYASYAPARIVLKTEANSASVLLLNDKFDPDWKVTVDGKPEPLLRCNFIMRGVALAPGPHTVELRFRPDIKLMYVSLAAVGLGLLLLLMLFVGGRNEIEEASKAEGQPKTRKK